LKKTKTNPSIISLKTEKEKYSAFTKDKIMERNCKTKKEKN